MNLFLLLFSALALLTPRVHAAQERTCHRFINQHVTAPICQPSREAIRSFG